MARNTKIICIVISLALAASVSTGCAKKDNNAFGGEIVTSKTVKTITTTSESYVETVDYEGFVTAKSIMKLSFSQSGKISALYAQAGQHIKEGDLLAELDTTFLNFAVKNAEQSVLMAENMISQAENRIEQINIANEAEKINLSKAEAAYEGEQISLEKIEDTHTSFISIEIRAERKNLDRAEDIYESERIILKQIKDTYNSLKLDYENAKNRYEECERLYEAGEISEEEYNDAKFAFDSIANEFDKAEQTYANDLALQEKNIDIAQENIDLIELNIRKLRNEFNKEEQAYANDLALQEKNIDIAQKDIDLQTLSISKMENDMGSVYLQIESAKLQKNQAVISLEQYNMQLSESTMLSPADGYVVDVSTNTGEIIGAGTPVIILKSIEQIVTIGVTVNDLPKIIVGMKVDMNFSGTSFTGIVSSVGQYPDENSRTYSVKITPETNDIPAGALVSVKIPIKTRSVVSVPVNAMFSVNGVNYVYCAEKEEDDDRYKAIMKEVLPDDVYGSNVIALNLVPGTVIVADDVKSIKENDWLSIID